MRVGTNANTSAPLLMASGGGKIAEPRVYNRALSYSEGKTLYFLKRTAPHYITIKNLATDAIKSLNYSEGSDGSFFDLSNGEFKSYDSSGGITRSLEFGPGLGLLAKDENGKVFHDIPTNNVASDNYYLGHAIFFNDNSGYLLYSQGVSAGFETVTCITEGNTNAKGAILRVNASWDGDGTSSSRNPIMDVFFRPKGAAWSNRARMPGVFFDVSTYDNEDFIFQSFDLVDIITIPLGTNNQIEFDVVYSCDTPTLNIHQLGIFV